MNEWLINEQIRGGWLFNMRICTNWLWQCAFADRESVDRAEWNLVERVRLMSRAVLMGDGDWETVEWMMRDWMSERERMIVTVCEWQCMIRKYSNSRPYPEVRFGSSARPVASLARAGYAPWRCATPRDAVPELRHFGSVTTWRGHSGRWSNETWSSAKMK